MATQKKTYLQKLLDTHKLVTARKSEMDKHSAAKRIAEQSGSPELLEFISNSVKRYEEDFMYLSQKRAYLLGKVMESDPKLFDKVLNEVLA